MRVSHSQAVDRHRWVPALAAAGGRPTWLSTWNWMSNSMLPRAHTRTLPSSPHVAQWDSSGLKATSFTCGKQPEALSSFSGGDRPCARLPPT